MFLRPAVVADDIIGYQLEAGAELDRLVDVAKECDLLLVVGTSLGTDPFSGVLRDIARVVCKVDGAIVYIDQAPLPIRWTKVFDFHLQGDIEDCFQYLLDDKDEEYSELMLESWQEVCRLLNPDGGTSRNRKRSSGTTSFLASKYKLMKKYWTNDANNQASGRSPNISDVWEQGSYHTLIVYITHGMSSDRGLQISDNSAHNAVEFLDRTLDLAEDVLRRSISTHVFLLCCGHLSRSPEHTLALKNWVDTASIVLFGFRQWTFEGFFELWLQDEFAPTHTDVIYFERNAEVSLILFSPFQTRPLGRELPNVLMTCTCPGLDERLGQPGRRIKKTWKVTHNAKNKMDVNTIRVDATCTVCRQRWTLPTAGLRGKILKVSGLYAVVVPYFVS
ncbi:hypothetical protein FRC11_013076 [Ceratobasidium sp. 423]|nr:hypothetical protein FRC11_013076 [Ceratobasidium sp. 423]